MAEYRAVYGFKDEGSKAAAEYTDKAVYGLPELNAIKLRDATVVANPGCYATSVILALAPLLKAGVVDKSKRNHFRLQIRRLRRRQRAYARKRISFPSRTISRPTDYSVIVTWGNSRATGFKRRTNSLSRRICCRFRAEFFRPSTCI